MLPIRTCFYLAITFSSLPLVAATMSLPQTPLQGAGYMAPNVMLIMDNSGSMRSLVADTGLTRMEIAKSVAKEVVEANPDIRFCLAKFNNNQGGQIVNKCMTPAESIGSSDGSIINNLDGLQPATWTPLAETYYEVIRYFAGQPSAYNSLASPYTSPIQYSCQKNFTMVLTDGEAFYDATFPSLEDMSGNQVISSPDYDADGEDGDGSERENFRYLDDFAKYAWDADLAPSKIGLQNMHTYTIGFEIENQMLIDAAEKAGYGHGSFQRADTATGLANTFNSALESISSKTQSVAAITSSSEFLVSGTVLNVYQSRYLGGAWTGELVAWPIDPMTLQLSVTPAWTAPLPRDIAGWENRVIFSGYNDGIVFNSASFKEDQYGTTQSELDLDTWFKEGDTDLIPYLRGKLAADITAIDVRPRDSLLGDIINSSPVYVSSPKKGIYRDDAFPGGERYSDFVDAHQGRKKMLFVGANDGMLHGFDAADGTELLGFYPSAVLPNLRALANRDYSHQFYVDGTPTVSSVYDDLSKTWRTLLVGGLRRGGQSIYALDISNPELFIPGIDQNARENAAQVVRWEFDDTDDADMGYSYSQPKTMRLGDGKFYVVLGNGYNSTENDGNVSTTGDAVLYLLDVANGAKIKISTEVGTDESPSFPKRGNGLSTVTGFDATNNGKIDHLYGGDLFGNVWKFDVSDPDATKWVSSTKLFTACGETDCIAATSTSDNNHQPITTAIEVAKTQYGKIMLFFGTGKWLEVEDTRTANIAKQSFYGLIDDDSTAIADRSDLIEQKILFSGRPVLAGVTFPRDIRVTTAEEIKAEKGWFMDIQVPSYESTDTLKNIVNQRNVSPVYSIEGEQVLVKARYSKGVISFFTKKMSTDVADPCAAKSSNSFGMELNALSGSRLVSVRSDANDDGVVDEKDSIDSGDKNTLGESVLVVVSGKEGGNGSGSIDITLTDNNDNHTDKVLTITGPGINGVASKIIQTGYRTSWREITND